MTLQVHLSGSDMRFRFRGQAVPAEILVQALDFLVKLSICHTYVKYLSGRWVPTLTGTRVWLVLSWGKYHNLRSIVSIPEQRGTQISLAYFHSYQDGYRTTHPNLVSWGGAVFSRHVCVYANVKEQTPFSVLHMDHWQPLYCSMGVSLIYCGTRLELRKGDHGSSCCCW